MAGDEQRVSSGAVAERELAWMAAAIARRFCALNPRLAPLASHVGLSARIRYGWVDDVLDHPEAEAVCRRAVVAAVGAGEDEDTAKRRLAAHLFGRATTRLLYPEQGTFPGATSAAWAEDYTLLAGDRVPLGPGLPRTPHADAGAWVDACVKG